MSKWDEREGFIILIAALLVWMMLVLIFEVSFSTLFSTLMNVESLFHPMDVGVYR